MKMESFWKQLNDVGQPQDARKPTRLRFPLLSPTRKESKAFYRRRGRPGLSYDARSYIDHMPYVPEPSSYRSVSVDSRLPVIRQPSCTMKLPSAKKRESSREVLKRLSRKPALGKEDAFKLIETIADALRDNFQETCKRGTVVLPSIAGYHPRSNSPTFTTLLETRLDLEKAFKKKLVETKELCDKNLLNFQTVLEIFFKKVDGFDQEVDQGWPSKSKPTQGSELFSIPVIGDKPKVELLWLRSNLEGLFPELRQARTASRQTKRERDSRLRICTSRLEGPEPELSPLPIWAKIRHENTPVVPRSQDTNRGYRSITPANETQMNRERRRTQTETDLGDIKKRIEQMTAQFQVPQRLSPRSTTFDSSSCFGDDTRSDWNQSSFRDDSVDISSVAEQRELEQQRLAVMKDRRIKEIQEKNEKVRPSRFDDVITQRTKTKAVRRLSGLVGLSSEEAKYVHSTGDHRVISTHYTKQYDHIPLDYLPNADTDEEEEDI